MLYKDQPNTLEMAKAFLHFIITLSVCVVLGILLSQQQAFVHSLIPEMQVLAISALLNILVIIAVFIIFNTSYYAFVSYQRVKMLIFAIVFLFLGCTKLVTIILNAHTMSTGSSTMLFKNAAYSYMALGDLFFVIGILISAFIPFELKVNHKNKAIYKLLPLAGVFAFIIVLAIFTQIVKPLNHELVIVSMNRLYLALLLTALISNLILFIRNNNGYLIRVCSGLLLIFTARMVQLIGGPYLDVVGLGSLGLDIAGFYVIFTAVFRFNVGLPLQDLKNAEKQIKLYADNLERIIDKRTLEVRKSNEKFIHELDYAKSIQQSLLPVKKANYKDIQFVSEYFPCERLSGDFYDIYRIDEENVGMYVLDVSGHGISAALMTMFCNNVIKSSEKLIKRYRGLKPHRNLMHFYEEFNKMNFPDEMHMVIFYASYNTESCILTYCSGGMNCHPIVVKENGTLIYLDNSKGFPICKMGEFYTPEFTSATIKLEKNDLVVFYTDGLVDRDKNKCLDEEGFAELLIKNHESSLRSLNAQITKTINSNLHHIDDDITYFIMKVTKGEKNEGYSDPEGPRAD